MPNSSGLDYHHWFVKLPVVGYFGAIKHSKFKIRFIATKLVEFVYECVRGVWFETSRNSLDCNSSNMNVDYHIHFTKITLDHL